MQSDMMLAMSCSSDNSKQTQYHTEESLNKREPKAHIHSNIHPTTKAQLLSKATLSNSATAFEVHVLSN